MANALAQRLTVTPQAANIYTRLYHAACPCAHRSLLSHLRTAQTQQNDSKDGTHGHTVNNNMRLPKNSAHTPRRSSPRTGYSRHDTATSNVSVPHCAACRTSSVLYQQSGEEQHCRRRPISARCVPPTQHLAHSQSRTCIASAPQASIANLRWCCAGDRGCTYHTFTTCTAHGFMALDGGTTSYTACGLGVCGDIVGVVWRCVAAERAHTHGCGLRLWHCASTHTLVARAPHDKHSDV